jgi:hypothetical protein
MRSSWSYPAYQPFRHDHHLAVDGSHLWAAGPVLVASFFASFPWAWRLYGRYFLVRRGARRLVRLFALVSAMDGLCWFLLHDPCHASCWALSLTCASGVLLTYFALRRFILWMALFLAPVGVDVRRVVSFLAVPFFVRTVCSLPP